MIDRPNALSICMPRSTDRTQRYPFIQQTKKHINVQTYKQKLLKYFTDLYSYSIDLYSQYMINNKIHLQPFLQLIKNSYSFGLYHIQNLTALISTGRTQQVQANTLSILCSMIIPKSECLVYYASISIKIHLSFLFIFLDFILFNDQNLKYFYIKLRRLSFVMGGNSSIEGEWERVVKQKYNKQKGELNFSDQKYKAFQILQILEACQTISKDVIKLNLNWNRISSEGAKFLAIAQFHNLSSLSLGKNNIGAAGVKHLVTGNLRNITHLDLWKNRIGVEGAKILGASSFYNLSYLDISGNRIGNEGVKYLTNMNFSLISQLWLRLNGIRYEGLKYLILSDLSDLIGLGLNWNIIEQAEKKQIKLFFQQKNREMSVFL